MEMKKIAELAKILRQNQLTKLDLTEGDCHLILESDGAKTAKAPVSEEYDFQEEAAPVQEPEAKEEPKAPAFKGFEQKSPLVGTAYLAPQSGAKPFVEVGSYVRAGDVLCIVESMKMFNNIEAEQEGTIEEICVENGQLVEFGQPLFRILPA